MLENYAKQIYKNEKNNNLVELIKDKIINNLLN